MGAGDVLGFLHDAGLADPETSRIVWTRVGRHTTTLVETAADQSWLVKRCGEPLVTGSVSLENERRIHHLSRELGLSRRVASALPRLVHESDDGYTLVMQGFPHLVTLRDLWLSGAPVATAMRHLGHLVADLHATPIPADSTPTLVIADDPVITFGHPTPEQFMGRPPSFVTFLQLVQGELQLLEPLRALKRSWLARHVIHGDLKAENVLTGSGSTIDETMVLVDWELAAIGDRAWDCGVVVGSLYFTLLQRLGPGGDQELTVATVNEQVHQGIREFFVGYLTAASDAPRFDHVLAWAGYWLLAQVHAALPVRRGLSDVDLFVLHLAAHLLAELDFPQQTDQP